MSRTLMVSATRQVGDSYSFLPGTCSHLWFPGVLVCPLWCYFVLPQSRYIISSVLYINNYCTSACNLYLYTVDGFIFVGINFRGLSKSIHSWGSKFIAIAFSFIFQISWVLDRGVTIYRYIGISQYRKNLYRIAIRNSYRNISRIFFLLIKLIIFHSILVM